MSAKSSCVGIDSSEAGKAAGCQGCPNASICASMKDQKSATINEQIEINNKLSTIKNIVLVISGKGGVGKSTISASLARLLAADESINVGLLDIDICGPSIPRALGLEGEQVHMSADGWSPIYVQDNLAVMSGGFLLDSLDDAVIWRGPKKNGLIKQFLRDVDWSELDFLIVDTPPGTSDEHLSIVNYIKDCKNVRGAILVTTPQETALNDVRKQIDFCRRVGLPLIGVVENMIAFVCPNCHGQSTIFKATTGGAAKLCQEFNLTLLASVPLDPLVAKAIDEGTFLNQEKAKSETLEALIGLSDRLVKLFS